MMRRAFAALNGEPAEMVLNRMAQTRTNDEFLHSFAKETASMARSRQDDDNGRY